MATDSHQRLSSFTFPFSQTVNTFPVGERTAVFVIPGQAAMSRDAWFINSMLIQPFARKKPVIPDWRQISACTLLRAIVMSPEITTHRPCAASSGIHTSSGVSGRNSSRRCASSVVSASGRSARTRRMGRLLSKKNLKLPSDSRSEPHRALTAPASRTNWLPPCRSG